MVQLYIPSNLDNDEYSFNMSTLVMPVDIQNNEYYDM